LPWYDAGDESLPVASSDLSLAAPWQSLCERLHVRLVAVCADVVEPERFNRLVRQHDNKAAATSRIAMQVLRRAWPLDREGEVLVVADKHGGRNRYEPLLAEAFPERTVVCLEEGADRSVSFAFSRARRNTVRWHSPP
jgi:ribonuclease HIII